MVRWCMSAISHKQSALCPLRCAISDLLDSVYAESAFGAVEVAVANEVMGVVARLKEMGFDDALGGFVAIGRIVGDGERGLGGEGVLNLREMF